MSPSDLQTLFTALPESAFKTRTLADLSVGDKFIMLPIPGDEHTQGGYMGVFHLLEKIENHPENHAKSYKPGTRWSVRNVACDIELSMALDEPVVYIQ